MKNWKATRKKIWYFVWEDNSIWSWIVNIAIAFILIKFVVYPGLGFFLGTSHPVVAVVSESMEHNMDFGSWWEKAGSWYTSNGISKKDFKNFPLTSGFDRGDIIVLRGKLPKEINIGDVIVFWSAAKDPIIHRVVRKWNENEAYYFQTKGDHNADSIKNIHLDESRISQNSIVGHAVVRIPLLGYVKILFVEWIVNPLSSSLGVFLQKG